MQLSERLTNETGREYALRMIKKNIIMLELKPGCMVSENELSSELGLSRTPVREALLELSKTGIVEIYPQKGSRVSKINYDLVEESRFLRLVLERAVVELACDMATPEDLRALNEGIKLQELYIEHPFANRLLELDNEFHKQLFRITNKLQTYRLMDSMTTHFDRVRSLSLSTVKDIKIVEDHHDILNALKAKEKELVRDLMEKHLSQYKIDEEIIREKYPEYFV